MSAIDELKKRLPSYNYSPFVNSPAYTQANAINKNLVGTTAPPSAITVADQWNQSQGYGPTGAYTTPKSSPGSVLGVNSYSGNYQPSTSPSPVDNNLIGNAQAGRQSELDRIAQILALGRDMAGRTRQSAGDARSQVTGNINTTYQNLINSLTGKRDVSLQNLGQEDINVQNQYGRAEGNARRAVESALQRNRMAARAQNRLDSSFYGDTQAQTNETGARTLGELGTEQAGKRAAIGSRVTDTKNFFEQQSATAEQEKAQLLSEAEREYQDQIAQADQMERGYGIDATSSIQQAEQNYQSRLNQIQDYVQNKQLTLAQMAGARGNDINSFTALNPQLLSQLANARAINSTGDIQAQLNPTISTTLTPEQAAQRGVTPNAYDDLLKKLALNLTGTSSIVNYG